MDFCTLNGFLELMSNLFRDKLSQIQCDIEQYIYNAVENSSLTLSDAQLEVVKNILPDECPIYQEIFTTPKMVASFDEGKGQFDFIAKPKYVKHYGDLIMSKIDGYLKHSRVFDMHKYIVSNNKVEKYAHNLIHRYITRLSIPKKEIF